MGADVEEMTMEDFQEAPDRLFERAQKEAVVVRDSDGIVVTVGSEGDARLPEPEDDDEGPVVSYKTVSAPIGRAAKTGYFASQEHVSKTWAAGMVSRIFAHRRSSR